MLLKINLLLTLTKRYCSIIVTTMVLFLWPLLSTGQQSADQLKTARALFDKKEYAKAEGVYKMLYEQQGDAILANDVYNEYLNVLLAQQKHKEAEELIKQQIKRSNSISYSVSSPLYLIDLGKLYKTTGRQKKAEEQFEEALKYINGDDVMIQQMGNALTNSGNEYYAIKVYERAQIVLQQPMMYNGVLAKLYNKTGQTEKAIVAVLSTDQNFPQRGESTTESTLLEILGKDPEKIRLAQKTIIRQINKQPDNFYYPSLLIWLFSLQDDWDQAFVQVQALERRSNDKGKMFMDFAASALKQGKYDQALKAYDGVITYGSNNARYMQAREARLSTLLERIQNSPSFSSSEVAALEGEYEQFLKDFPTYSQGRIINDYALLEAQYAQHVKKAIALLKTAIESPGANRHFAGNSKLQLGDYYIIDNQVWEAALVYSQVDKTFREDALGEEARLRNAKLSYYRGDFEAAQGQLSVLKAATSELIANDALYLSVLITENIPPDSNMVPLERFAYADLLLFQNRTAEATSLLDSIATAFPKHPLNDDILMLHASIAQRQRDDEKAVGYLKKVIELYGKDVLADDATYRIAQIYARQTGRKEEALKFYEQLIIDYPGSTYVHQARQAIRELQSQPAP